MQLRLLLLGGILVPVLGSAQPPLEPPLRPLCRSDNAFGGDAGCDPALAFLDRGDAAFWTTEYAKTWRHFELPARANVGASRSGTTATDRAGKIEAALDTLAGSLFFWTGIGLDAPLLTARAVQAEMIALWKARGAIRNAVDLRHSETGELLPSGPWLRAHQTKHAPSAGTADAPAATEDSGGDDNVTLEFWLSSIPGGVGSGHGLARLLAVPGDAARLTTFSAAGRVIVAAAATVASPPLAAPYDSFVLQLAGTGLWTVCVPRAEALDLVNPATTDAERCLREAGRREASGYSVTDGYTLDEVQASGMRCASFTLRAGETLYLPKGAIHAAAAGRAGSARITLTLSWAGACWKDVLWDVVGRLPSLAQQQGAGGNQGRGTPGILDESLANGLAGALQVALEQPHGIVLHQPVGLLIEIVTRRLREQDYATLSQILGGLFSICAMALTAFFDNAPRPEMTRAIAVAQQLNHAAWLPEYTDNIAVIYARRMQDIQKTRERGVSTEVEAAVARAVYDQYAMVLEARTATAQFHFRQADEVEIEDTLVAFERAMAAKGELVAYAAQFPDLEFSVDDDLTDGDPEFAWLETGWMMHDFEHKVASGAILPKLRPLGLAPHTAPGAGSGVKPVEMASGLQEFPIHQYQRVLLARLPAMDAPLGVDWLLTNASAAELHDGYIAQNRPFILGPGHTDGWPATSRWTAEGLTSFYAGIAVNVSRSSTHLWQLLGPDQFHVELAAHGSHGPQPGWSSTVPMAPAWYSLPWACEDSCQHGLVLADFSGDQTHLVNADAIRGSVVLVAAGGPPLDVIDRLVHRAGGIGVLLLRTDAGAGGPVPPQARGRTDRCTSLSFGVIDLDGDALSRLVAALQSAPSPRLHERNPSPPTPVAITVKRSAKPASNATSRSAPDTANTAHGFQPLLMPMRHFVDSVLLHSNGTASDPELRYVFNTFERGIQPGFGRDQPHPLAADFEVPAALSEALRRGLTRPRHGNGSFEFMIGPTLGGAHLHAHPAAVNMLVRGRRRWVITPPHRVTAINAKTAFSLEDQPTAYAWWQRVLPGIKAVFPRALFEFYQEAGEIVYIPPKWGHAVLNLEPSVAVSLQVGDRPGKVPARSTQRFWRQD